MESARRWIEHRTGQSSLFSTEERKRNIDTVVGKYKYRGFRYGLVYETINSIFSIFGLLDEGKKVGWKMFLDLALVRAVEPASKRESQRLLESLFGINYDLTSIYRSMPGFCDFKDRVESRLMDFAKNHLGFNFSFVLYDITTLYFETFVEDELRRCGYSKDNKVGQPQILVGLIVSKEGFPLSSEVFEGSKFEGHTMIPVISNFKTRHSILSLTVVADAGMLSRDNIDALKRAGLDYIVGARLNSKSTSVAMALDIKTKLKEVNGASIRLETKDDFLVCSFSASRYKKDLHELEKQVEKAKLTVSGKRPTKNTKFVIKLKVGKGKIDQTSIDKTTHLLGIKGYRTNLNVPNNIIIERYSDLWQVEKAFRMSKNDLAVRPVYHFNKEPIIAHILICTLALAVLKFMEIKTGKSAKHVLDHLKSITDGLLLNTATNEIEPFRAESNEDVDNLLKKMNPLR